MSKGAKKGEQRALTGIIPRTARFSTRCTPGEKELFFKFKESLDEARKEELNKSLN